MKHVLCLFLSFFLYSCASQQVRSDIEDESSDVMPLVSLTAQQERIALMIEKSENLSPKLKEQLKILLRDSYSKLRDYVSKISQLKVVLTQELFSETPDKQKITLTKHKIEKLMKAKIALFYETIFKAKDILGVDSARHQRVIREMVGGPDF